MQRVKHRLSYVVPVTLLLIVLLLYMNTRSMTKTMIVMLAVPFSAIGAVWYLYLAGYNMSIAVWVGLIALLGVDAETGVFMLLYLDLAYEEAKRDGSDAEPGGFAPSHRQRSCQTSSSQIHDVCHYLHWPVSDHVGGWIGFRCHEAYRRSDGGRYLHFVPA